MYIWMFIYEINQLRLYIKVPGGGGGGEGGGGGGFLSVLGT